MVRVVSIIPNHSTLEVTLIIGKVVAHVLVEVQTSFNHLFISLNILNYTRRKGGFIILLNIVNLCIII